MAFLSTDIPRANAVSFDLPPGSHLCVFFERTEALVPLLARFVAAGLKSGERVRWILHSGLQSDIARAALIAIDPMLATAEAAGQLLLTPVDPSWGVEPVDPQRLISGLVREAEGAVRDGFSGFRITGLAKWPGEDGFKAFHLCEEGITRDLRGHAFRSLCAYELSSCTATQALTVLANHTSALFPDGDGWRWVESSDQRHTREQLEDANRQLEQRVRDGTAQVRTILNGFPGVVAYIGPDRRFRFTNGHFGEWMGSSESHIGKSISDVLGPKGAELLEPRVVRVLAGEEVRFEERVAYPTGVRDVQVDYVPDLSDGKVKGFFVFVQDIGERKKMEAALRQSENEFRAMFENAAVGMIQLDPTNGKFVRLNQRFLDIVGFTEDELRGKGFADITVAEDSDASQTAFETMIRTGFVQIEKRYRRKNGGEVWTSVHSALVRDSDGKPLHTISIVQDITERRQKDMEIEHLTREQERRLNELNALYNLSPVGIGIARDPECRFISVNTSGAAMIGGKTGENLSKSTVKDLPFSVFRNGVEVDHADLPMQRAARLGVEVHDEEYEIQRSDGQRVTLLEYAVPLFDENRKVRGAIGMWVDVTARKQGELALTQSEARYRTMTNAAGQMMWSSLPGGQVSYVNDRFFAYTGLDRDSAYNSEWSSVIHPEDVQTVNTTRARGVMEGKEYDFRCRFRRKDGTFRWHIVRVAPAILDGRVWAWVGAASDIQDLVETEGELARRAEDLARSNKELEQFAFVASHDLKEPLRKIAGYSELLQSRYQEKLDEKANRYLSYLQDGVHRMDAIIGDLLAYSRAGRGRHVREPVEVKAIVSDILDDLEKVFADARAVVDIGELPTVIGNATQIRQVFQNLMANAVKFRRDVAPVVRVSATREGDFWHFSLSDNGIGIEPQYFERIFEIFQRLHTRAEYPGTGIGLAICKKIVETHGGRIWLESKVGEGSTFHFTLPAA